MVALVWEAIAGVAFLLGGASIAAGVWGPPPVFRWRGIPMVEYLIAILLMTFGAHCLDLARHGYVVEKERGVTRYR
jgi:hypothetical protein